MKNKKAKIQNKNLLEIIYKYSEKPMIQTLVWQVSLVLFRDT